LALDSDTDRAFIQFAELVNKKALFRSSDPQLSEADTRAKLIDPLFRDVLGWTEAEIRRERPAGHGFADYVLGSDITYLLVEAKRTNPRFRLEAPSKSRRLRVDGPHLLGQKKIKPFVQQAQNYASSLGAQFAILTNGSQFIIFKPYLPGRQWTTGYAIVFHDHEDIANDFAFFYRLLSRDNVCAGGLLEEFEQLEGLTAELYTPIQFIHDADFELVRNPFWSKIARIIGPLLTDVSEDSVLQTEIIQNCYVTTPLSDEADAELDRRLRDTLTPGLKEAQFKDIAPGSGRKSAFGQDIEHDITSTRPGTYILTGGVGSGKTTFLRRFAAMADRAFVKNYCIWLHIDFLPIGNVDSRTLDPELRSFVFARVREELSRSYPDKTPQTGQQIRELFSEELQKAERTKLYNVPRESPDWTKEANAIVDALFNSDSALVTAILKRIVASGLRPVFVLDNTDQLGEQFQERVFLLAQKLSQDHKALAIVALREEKFFAAFRRGIFDAFGDRRFHIGSPDLGKVLRRRLEYGREKFRKYAMENPSLLPDIEANQIDSLLRTLIRSTTVDNANIVRMLACVSNGDMRHALDMFREFVSSGNTNVEKILRIASEGGGYTVAFHEFAKSAILGSRRYYRSSVSHVVNVFKQSGARRASHITALRILARLSRSEETPSPHGEGFVKTKTLLREYRESFGTAEDFQERTGELLMRGLVESEPPKIGEVENTEALRITASGAYYWKYLARAFAYIDLILVDTPLLDRSLARQLANLADSIDMADRFERVRLFIAYLTTREAEELAETARRAGPYQEALIKQVSDQVEEEMKVITRKLKLHRS